MREAGDDTIWEYAKEQGFVVVTKDVDFRRLSELSRQPPKVVLITLANGPTAEVETLLRERHADLLAFYEDNDRGFVEIP